MCGGGVLSCAYAWTPEVSFRGLSLLLSAFLSHTRSLSEAGTYCVLHRLSDLWPCCLYPLSHLPTPGASVIGANHYTQPFCGLSGSKLWSSYLLSMHFTSWVASPAHYSSFYETKKRKGGGDSWRCAGKMGASISAYRLKHPLSRSSLSSTFKTPPSGHFKGGADSSNLSCGGVATTSYTFSSDRLPGCTRPVGRE